MFANLPAVTHPGLAQALPPLGLPHTQPPPIFSAPRPPGFAGAGRHAGDIEQALRNRQRRDDPERCFTLYERQNLLFSGMPFRKTVVVQVPCTTPASTVALDPCPTPTPAPSYYRLSERYARALREQLCPKKKCKED